MKETSEEEGICVCEPEKESVERQRECVCDIKREKRRQKVNSEKGSARSCEIKRDECERVSKERSEDERGKVRGKSQRKNMCV